MHDRGNSLSLVRGFQLPAYVRPQNAGNYGVYTMFPETSRDGSPSLSEYIFDDPFHTGDSHMLMCLAGKDVLFQNGPSSR